MGIIIGGHNLGLLDGSFSLLNRNDQTGNGTMGRGVESYINVSNGNLVIQERDAFLPSQGMDFTLVRTYNSRGKLGPSTSGGWSWSSGVTLSRHSDRRVGQSGNVDAYILTYGDGTSLHFDFDAARNLWVSTDGAGAFETLSVVDRPANNAPAYIVTRANQTQYSFDKNFTLLSIADPNGVRMDFEYQGNRLVRIRDDSGHVLTYTYAGGDLASISDQTGTVLVRYGYTAGRLTSVTDRAGHVTTFTYNGDQLLSTVDLPRQQTVNGQVQNFEQRQIRLAYQRVTWGDQPHVNSDFDSGPTFVLSELTDAMGATTRFAYSFTFASSMAPDDRDAQYQVGGNRYLTGGTTTVTDASGATMSYKFDADGYITEVTDQLGFKTTYAYDLRDNLTRITDRRGFATDFTYDARGNLLSRADKAGNLTTYSYTAFDKVASMTAAMGNALATSNDAFYQGKRVELGFAADVATLSDADKAALRALYTTTYAYDAKQNLITRSDPGGDVTQFEYDAAGNLTKRTVVYRDAAGNAIAAKNQVTQYFYDAFGNNVRTLDAEGNTRLATFDRYGNVLTATDGRGGVTTNSYDADNRLLATTDPEGHTTINAYDAVGNKISITDANGKTVTQLFDKNNLLIATIDPAANAASTRTTSIKYDVLGNRTEVTDAEGRKTTYTYDARRQQIELKTAQVLNASDALVSYSERYAYDGEGNLLTLTDRNGNITQYAYSPTGLLSRYTNAVGNVTEYLYDANLQQIQITIGAQLAQPALRRVLRFSYDEENQLTGEVDALGATTRKTYDAPGNVVAVTNENGQTTDFEYDRNNRLVKETRPQVIDPVSGQPVRYSVLHAFDAEGNEVETTDENGHKTSYTFDRDNRRVTVIDGNEIKTAFTYDSRDNVTRIEIGDADGVDGPDGVVGRGQSFVYDEFNQLVAATDGLGNTKRYTYDKIGNLLTETDALGHVTSYTYDALNRLQTQTRTLNATTPQVTTFRYDGYAKIVKATDALGRSASYRYDGVDRLLEVTDALGVTTRYEYDHVGNRLSTTKAFGTADARTTRWEYDLDSRATKQIDAEGDSNSYEYDAVGNRLKVVDGRGGETRFVYDAMNRRIKVIDPLNFETRYEYDGVSNRIAVIDARGGVQRLVYDGGNRYVQTTDAEGRVTRFDYDVLGNIVTQTSAPGTLEARVTSFVYDRESNLREVTDAADNVVSNDYDANYNIITTTDANGNKTSYGYDALDRQIRVTDPLGGVKTYTYDLVGNALTETDEGGHARTFAYDANDRLLTETDSLGIETRYQYDSVGNRISITRAANTAQPTTRSFVYDNNDKLITETDALGGETLYEYDANNNVSKKTDANGHETTYVYDANNRLSTITDPLGGVTRYGYDANGNRTQVTDARGNITTTYYNRNNEQALTVDPLGYATARSYDLNGNVVSETRYATALALPVDPATRPTIATNPADQTTTFGYDELNRVVSLTDPLGGIREFAYDGVGNQLSAKNENGNLTRSAYDELNRRIAELSAEGYLTLFEYDAVGNQTKRSEFDGRFSPASDGGAPTAGTGSSRTTTYTYDDNRRLTGETSPIGVTTRFEYDAVGNRTAKVEAAGIVGIERRTEVRYDANDRVVETVDALGTVTRSTRDVVGNETEVRQALGTPAERVTTYEYDANNRVAKETDALGIVSELTYDANGNVTQRRSAVGLPEERTERFEYDAKNQLTAEVNGAGARTAYAYDATGNRITITVAPGQPEQRINRFRYDRDNRLVGEIDGNGVETQYRHDAAGNKIETIQLAAAYDSAGNPVSTYGGQPIAGLDRHTLFTYDKDDRLLSVKNPLEGVTTYEYDALGNQTKITDAGGTVTENTFDANGRLTRNLIVGADHGGVVVSNEYDVFGNVVRTRQGFADGADTRQITYAYDKLDRRTLVTEYDRVAQLTPTSVFAQAFSTAFTYDAFGNQTSLARGVYLLAAGDPGYDADKAARARPLLASFGYDKLDRTVSTTDGAGNRIAYAYDALGNRIGQTTGAQTQGTTADDSRTVSFAYDKAGRLVSRITQTGARVDFTYDQAGNQTTKTISDGSGPARVTTYKNDGNGRLIEEIDPLGNVTGYALDAFGNQVETRFAAGTADERIVKTEFNDNDEKIADIDALGNRTDYQVDKMGNRIKETDPLGRVTRLYYDNRNQQVGTLDAGGFLTTFERDAAGNITRSDVYMNRYTAPASDLTPPLPGAGDPVRTTTSVYDGSSDLISQTAPDGIVTEYLRDSAGKLLQLTTLPSTDATARSRTADLTPRVRKFNYDLAGRLVEYTNADGTIETYAYDTANNRIRETVTNPNALANGGADPARTTALEYDRDNRLIRQTVDPGGLGIVESLAYDVAGNVVRKTDGNGNVTTSVYDLNDRLVSVTDAAGNTTRFAYDRVGNQIAITDPRGNKTDLEFDKNNRLTKEIQPAVNVFTIAGGAVSNVRPTITTRYDAVGNVLQVIDANGFKTTSFYDADNNKIAEINGDNALRTYTYDATGAQLSATLYMTRVAASAHDQAVPPTGTGEARTLTSEYDAAGRTVRQIYPQADITTLSGIDTGSPTATTSLVAPVEENRYDAFGNLVESIDKRGGRSVAYFDAVGRAVATVDAGGYLTETGYDSQGNVVQQRRYRTPLDVSQVAANAKPVRPATDADVADRVYDAASRQIEEISPPVKLGESASGDVLERVRTRYTYDANGNRTSRTLAFGTPEAASEHYFYDGANRRVAVVSAERTLNTFAYDGNGNTTQQSRFINPVPATVTLPGANLDSIVAAVTPDPAQDETTVFAYDPLNRLSSQTDRLVGGDITTSSAYDAAGNTTRRVDGEGFVTEVAFDALGHYSELRSPNGAASFIEYDAAGLKVRAWTGGLPNSSAQQATNVAANFGAGLTISWTQPGSGSQSWVVWDTSARDVRPNETPDRVYPNKTGRAGSGAVAVSIPLTSLPAGTVLYFRVVSQDSAGNLAWTEERSAVIPPGIASLAVARAGNDLTVRVSFTSAVTGPVLKFGTSGGPLGSSAAFALQADGSYLATIASPADAQALSFQVEWTAGGQNLSSAVIPFEAAGEHGAVGPVVGIPLPRAGGAQVGNGQLVLVDGVRVDAQRVNDQLQFTPQLTTNGTFRYDVFFGTLAGANHTVKLTSRALQSTIQDGADTVNRDGDGNITSVVRRMQWTQTYETQVEATLGAGASVDGTVHAAFKAAGATTAFTGDVALTLAAGKYTGTLALDPGDYDVKIFHTDASGREVIVEWRRITVAAATLPASFDVTDNTAPFDFVGQETELNLTAEVADPAGERSFTGRSLTVLASETEGSIQRAGASPLSVDAGLYLGPLDASAGASPIQLGTSGSSGAGSLSTDGLQSQTYFTEIEYNALGDKIASNEDSGIWREFGVDANGNAVVSRLYGAKADKSAGRDPVISYAAFDALDRQIAKFDAAAPVAGESGLQRAVTRTTYDYAGRRASVLDPGDAVAQRFEYDGAGNLISATDALGQQTKRNYNRRGDAIAEIDPSGHAKAFAYDLEGRVIGQTNEVGKTTTLRYDAFGRFTAAIDPLTQQTSMTYDQRDRLVTVTDALGNVTTRYYDKRDKEIWLEDAEGRWFGTGYDPMGLVSHQYSFFTQSPTSLAEAQAALDPGDPLHEELIDQATTYDVFGNRIEETDANGRKVYSSYGAFGRLLERSQEDITFSGSGAPPIALSETTEYDRFGGVIKQTSSAGQDIGRSYDAVGRLIEVNDRATGVKTTYSYHLNGQRATEKTTVGGDLTRDVTYTYDATDRLVRWQDAVTGENASYEYDASGNLSRVANDLGSVVHTYTYYADGRIATFNKGDGDNSFTYDDAGNRVTWNEAGTLHNYSYDAADRVIAETDDAANQTQSWTYDKVGNIVEHVEDGETTTSSFLANNLISESTSGTQTTTTTFDKTGRTLSQTISGDGQSFVYTFDYSPDGTQRTVTGQGEGAVGSSFSFYDENLKLIRLSLGKGDQQDSEEFRTFVYNNDGQIIVRFYDDGKSATPNATTQYLYANGNPVAHVDDQGEMVLDEGPYDLVKIIAGDFPVTVVSDYVVRGGDTLQSIAQAVYGNPSLWFVIADANGLSGSEELEAGTHLKIPNSAQNGRITAETHALYQEGEIVGSKLPNLKSPPPPQTAQQSQGSDNCAVIAAIILVVLVAIVAIVLTVVTVGLAAPAAAAALGVTATSAAGIIVGVAVGAAIGAAIGFAASAITQGILIGFGLQKEFDWKQVAADVVVGAIGGIAAAIAGTIQIAAKAAQLGSRLSKVIAIAADTALNVAGEAAGQAIVGDGRIEQPWMLGVAAAGTIAGELLGNLGSRAFRAVKKAVGTADDAAKVGGKVVKFVEPDGTVVSKSSKNVAFKPTDNFSPLKAADTKFKPASSTSKIELDVKNAGDIFIANGKQHGWKPGSWTDTAASTLSGVQSPSKLDLAPNGKVLDALNDLNAGGWAKFTKKTTVDFAQATVGKVGNKTVPIADATGTALAAVDKKLTGTAADLVAVPKQPAVTPPPTIAEAVVDPTAVTAALATPPTGTAKIVRTADDYPFGANQYSKRLDDLVAQRGATAADSAGLPPLPDYNDIDPNLLANYRQQFQDHLGPQFYDDTIDEIKLRQQSFPEIKDAQPEDLLGARVYTLEASPFKSGGTALDPTDTNLGDYRVLNGALRAQNLTRLAQLDPYLKLTSTSIGYFPEYRGVTYRGVDANFPPTVLDTFKPGAVVTERGFTSTAVDPKAPFGFQPETLFVVNVRKGNDISSVSKYPDEAEILFRPNTRFKVLDVQDTTGETVLFGQPDQIKRIIYLDQIPT